MAVTEVPTEIPTQLQPDFGPSHLDPEVLARAIVGERPWLTIAEAASAMGVTAHTLRYYERIGLVTVPRDAAGRRRYSVPEVGRVVVITRLRLTAMPIQGIQEYFRLVDAGPSTVPQRRAQLEDHRARVVAQIASLRDALAVVDFKIDLYRGSSR